MAISLKCKACKCCSTVSTPLCFVSDYGTVADLIFKRRAQNIINNIMLANFRKLKKPRRFYNDEKKIKNKLFEILDNSVKELVGGYKKIPIAFSGGLDSSIIAHLASKYAKPVLFCVGFKNSHDVILSQKSTKTLNLDLNIIHLDNLNLKKYLDKTVRILKTNDNLITDLNVPLFIILEELRKQNYKAFVSGQGADTLFGGFARYPYNKEFGEEMFFDIKNIYQTNLQYNFKIYGHFKITPLYPFLEKEVVKFAVKISSDLKIKNGIQKYILREAFREYLPKEIVERKKKSFQYGSGVHKALKKFNAFKK